MDDDGRPETLRLFFATPKRWLENGKTIRLDRAPTEFGPVSVHMESKLEQGEVIAQLDLPLRNEPKQILLRARVPDGWKVVAAQTEARPLTVDERGTVDVSSLKGKAQIRFQVKQLR